MEPIRQIPKSALPGAKLTFGYFPAFAAFIKNNYLIPYIQEQLLLSKAIDLPLLKYFAGIPHDELISMSIPSNTEFLLYAEQNKLDDQINLGIDRWLSDQSTVIKRDEVVAEDLTLAAYVRKMALMKFLPSYTSDMTEMLAIVAEIETFTTAYLTRTSNTFIALLRKRISDETHFSESISDVTPGLNYVFSLKDKLIKYANKNYLDHFGYSLRELQEIGRGIIPEFMHPEDLENHRAQLKRCKALEDKEVNVWEYRLNDRRGGFKWMRNYASVFKRNAGGTVDEIIGIILDIDHEKRNAEKLLYSEQQLMQAQAITHTGSWSWDLQTDEVLWSDELYRIYELDPHNENVDPAISRLYRHPDDMAMVDAEMEKLRETYQPVDYNYRIHFFRAE